MVVRELREWERIAAHSHITGLGLEGLKAKFVGDGFVGQCKAREAAGIVVRLIKSGKFAGRAVLIAGPPGTGKTALAYGIARELGRDVPFVPISASEIYSAEVKKTEFLTQMIRKAIGVRIKERRKIYEGEVRNVEIEKKQHPYNPFYQIPISAKVELATKQETKKISGDQSFAIQIIQQGIDEGDIIQIDVEDGRVIKLGVSERAAKLKGIDVSAERILPMPDGPVMKEKEFVYTLTLHELDLARARSSLGIFDLFFGRERKEIDPEVRREVDETVKRWVEEGRAELIPGVIFIDECSLLDIETFAFLNRALEQELSPIIIFATNRGIAKIRGTDQVSPHAMPVDLLDRVLIITTRPYSEEEIKEIIKIRASHEKIKLSPEALESLVKAGAENSLRYALQLLAPASEIAKEKGREEIKKEDIERAKELFVSVKESSKYLKEFEDKFLKY